MLFLIVASTLLVDFNSAEYRIVNISSGAIRGQLVKSPRGPKGYAFLGVPTTEPPIGELRFKEAVPIKPWQGVIDTLEYISCPQPERKLRLKDVQMSENCLHINVYTSKTCLTKGGCPVIVYVNGGMRYSISPERTPPENVINNFANDERNIVFVAFAFRLGILGWLNLAPSLDISVPSNLQNRDVIFGLKWVQNEIVHFGGDKTKVTFMGHSSGAQMVVEMIHAPATDAFFSQAVMMSPAYWGDRNSNANTKYSQKIAYKVGCAQQGERYDSQESVRKIVNCLREKKFDELFAAQESMDYEVEMLEGVWVDGLDGIFPGTFEELKKREFPKKRYLMGTTSAEMKITRYLLSNGQINTTQLEYLCALQGYEFNYEHPELFKEECIKHYSNVDRFTDFIDDHVYYFNVGEFADRFSQESTTFMYSFEYPVKGERFSVNASVITPRHADDLSLILWGAYENFTEKEFQIEKIYSGIVANFARTGEPSWEGQEWRPWSKENRSYFVIDFDDEMKMPGIREGYHQEAADFFGNVVPNIVGRKFPLIDLPPKHDSFFFQVCATGVLAVWQNEPNVLSKNLNASMETGKIWMDHLIHLQELAVKRAYSFNWLNLLLAIIIIALVIGIVYAMWSHWKKRREYQNIL